MTSILLAGGIVLGGAAAGARLLARWARRKPDLAWRSTGLRFTTGRDYLQAQGIANSIEARKHTPSGRRYQHHVEPVATRSEAVVPTLRRPADVVQFHRRRA